VTCKKDWPKISDGEVLIVSPNALQKSKPDVSETQLVLMHHEKVLNYWKDIKDYLSSNAWAVKLIKVIVSDIDVERVKRDFNLIFSDMDIKVEYDVKIVSNSVWKTVYKMREKLILLIPFRLYELLGRNR